MADPRRVNKVFSSQPTIEGAGVHLRRAFGFSEVPLFDPFLMLDDFRGDRPSTTPLRDVASRFSGGTVRFP
jgi:quercetin 2,3-dioxygenase